MHCIYFKTIVYFLAETPFKLAEYITILPTLRCFNILWLILTLAIPLELVLALNVRPLNLKVTTLFFSAAEPFLNKACNVNFLRDLLTIIFCSAILVFLYTLFLMVPP